VSGPAYCSTTGLGEPNLLHSDKPLTIDSARVNHPPLRLPREVSPRLARWVWKSPHQRYGIVQTVSQFARSLPPGTRVLDAGAGLAPYRELFSHCQYKTSDHIQREPPVDIVCAMGSFPLPDHSFDAVICTEVIEHVPDPLVSLTELHRLLVPGGHLCLTMPFMLGVHEVYDFTRLTVMGLRAACERAGFEVLAITPRYGLPMTLWSLIWASALRLAHPESHMSGARTIGRLLLGSPVLSIAVLLYLPLRAIDPLDVRQDFTLGYSVVARRPLIAQAEND
jgi:SAM-dependent methyltransferase